MKKTLKVMCVVLAVIMAATSIYFARATNDQILDACSKACVEFRTAPDAFLICWNACLDAALQ